MCVCVCVCVCVFVCMRVCMHASMYVQVPTHVQLFHTSHVCILYLLTMHLVPGLFGSSAGAFLKPKPVE